MRADEPAAAGHEDASHVPSALARAARQSRSPSLQCGSRGASACTVRRIEQAGRGAGRCSSLEEIGSTRARQARLLHDRAREAVPARRAAAGEVVDAGRAALDELQRGAREVRRRRRAADLVVDHAQLVALRPQAQHREQEVAAARREHPGRAHDVGLRVLGQERALARELGGAVDAARRDRRALVVAGGIVAREHVVGREPDERGPARARRAGDVAAAVLVRAPGAVGIRLRAVDVGPGGAVQDELGAVLARTPAATESSSATSSSARPSAAASAPSSSANSRPSWPPPPVTSTRVMRRAERASGSSSTTGPARARRPSARSARRGRRGRTPR